MSKPTILIVDDMKLNRELLIDILSDSYYILEAGDGGEALRVIEENKEKIDAILLDVMMPGIDGFGVIDGMTKMGLIEDMPVIMISAEDSPEYIARGYDAGVADYITRPFNPYIVQKRVRNMILLYERHKFLTTLIKDQISKREEDNSMLIDVLSSVVEFRNGESGPHVLHIRRLTELLLEQLEAIDEKYAMSIEERSLWATASAMHDIGKIAIDDKILNKPGRLTDEEFAIMKKHSEYGYDILDQLDWYRGVPLIEAAKKICRWHHERWDGHGYPDGISGDDIPIPVQVVSIADVYDALTSERVYKAAFSHEKAIDMITHGECGKFNPDIIEALLRLGPNIKEQIDNSENEDYTLVAEKVFETLKNHRDGEIDE